MDTAVILEVKKLLALGESSNEHEAKLAIFRAQELLAKHKLPLKEIKEYQYAKINVIENKTEHKVCLFHIKTLINFMNNYYLITNNITV